ncbi:GTP-binding protein [Candidatus Woesearchaeota archaeon]|nr:GTP-binding protein [Candidatus Woesearchaeota archaeon]
MNDEHMRIVIVGHVDHGKSTLIGRLFFDTDSLPDGKMDEIKKVCEQLGRDVEFAYVLDHLQEEREQSVTIDTTQMFFKTKKRHYVIIDAPGHVEFTKNMITGASQAEAAILIVDGEEGVQEQTKRHAYILGMLGLKQVIAVINKMDLVDYKQERFEKVREDLLKFLDSINIKPTYVIPISAKEGDNVAKKSEKMSWYNGMTILESLDTFSINERPINKPLRYPIQDVYKFDEKRILAGRIESGLMKKGDEIVFLPSGKETKIKSIEVFEGQKETAEAGECIGITLEHPLFIDRGEVACKKNELPIVADRFTANVFWMAKQPFDSSETIILKCATQEVECNIEKINKKLDSSTLKVIGDDADELKEREVGEISFKTKEPIVIENFNDIQELGRFVLVKNQDVSAGGIITQK